MKQNIPITIHGQSHTSGPIYDQIPPEIAAKSLYIHVPFCFHKCHYCDFYSFVDTRDQQPDFLAALEAELSSIASFATKADPLDTIFIGGGTPTLLALPLWERLLAALHHHNFLSSADPSATELTVECNPETATEELFALLKAAGVNRISIGAQSFNPTMLKTLERWHDPPSVRRALQLARAAGIERASIDLIFAIPGQTLDMWDRDLDQLCAFASEGLIDHASCYALTYEPNTAMTMRLNRAEFEPIDEDIEAQMYERTVQRLADAGLHRYEVSNFARPASECRHNLAYWRAHDWLAAGPSASAHLAGHRWKNVPRLGDWMLSIHRAAFPLITDHEPPDPRRALAERIMLGIRITEGLPLEDLRARARALAAEPALESEIARQINLGFVEITDNHLRLTDPGFLYADGVAADLMSTLGA